MGIAFTHTCIIIFFLLLSGNQLWASMHQTRLTKVSIQDKLITAIRTGDLAECKKLVKKGAIITTLNDGMNALHEAVLYGKSVNLVRWLIRNWPSLLLTNREHSCTLLHYAVLSEQKEVIAFMIERDPSTLRARDTLGRTPLTIAQIANNQSLVVWLESQIALLFPPLPPLAPVEQVAKKRSHEAGIEEPKAKKARTQ